MLFITREIMNGTQHIYLVNYYYCFVFMFLGGRYGFGLWGWVVFWCLGFFLGGTRGLTRATLGTPTCFLYAASSLLYVELKVLQIWAGQCNVHVCPKSPDAVLRGYISGVPWDYKNGIGAKRCVSYLSFVWVKKKIRIYFFLS
jgi:hypothetical protein